MKYQQGKIKKEHHSLKEFSSVLHRIELLDDVQRIIPGRISRQQKGTSKEHVTFSYTTHAGLKLIMKKGGTAQEVFIVCKEAVTTGLIEKMRQLEIITKK